MIRWLIDLWRARQRQIDLEILWPECCRQAGNIDYARAVFATHALRDPAWTCLGHEYVIEFIGDLEEP